MYHLPKNIQFLSVCHNAKIPIPYLASMILKTRSSPNPTLFPLNKRVSLLMLQHPRIIRMQEKVEEMAVEAQKKEGLVAEVAFQLNLNG